MLTQVDVVYENELGSQALALPIASITPKSSLLISSITGLNPPDITLFIGDYARDGGTYQGRRVENRNPVITIDLNPNPALDETVKSLRELLYKTFVDPQIDSDAIELVLHVDDGRKLYLSGYTEKFETAIFSSDSQVQVSVVCPDPYIRDVIETALTHDAGWVTIPFTYSGTSETGFEAEVYLSSDTTVLNLLNNNKLVRIDYNFINQNVNPQVIYVNTNPGSRSVLLADKASVDTFPYKPWWGYTDSDDGGWNSSSTYASGDYVLYRIQIEDQTFSAIYQANAAVGVNETPPGINAKWTFAYYATLSGRWAALQHDGATLSLIGYLDTASVWPQLHSQNNVMTVYGLTTSDIPATIKSLSYTTAYWGV